MTASAFNLKPCLGMFRMKLIAGMQYRAAAWAGVATQFFWGGMQILVFYAFYESSGMSGAADAPMTFSQLADFIWMRQAFIALVALWSMDNELLVFISDGNIAYELARPLSLYSFWFARILGFRISRAILRCVPILVFAAFLPGDWAFHLPHDINSIAVFIPSLVLTALLVTALSMFTCLLTIISLNPSGARIFMGAVCDFFMGILIPIPFMPPVFRKVLSFLPFPYMADFPFRVYSGNISGTAALQGLGMQVFWLVLLTAGGALCFRSALKRLVVQGG